VKTPTAAEIARRFVRFAPGRSERYFDGIANPAEDWEKNTKAAEANYETGVKNAITRKAFGKGVTKCGTARQQAKTIQNQNRWPEGIEGAEAEMTDAMGPVVAVLQATTLPQRYPKGDPRNYKRVEVVGTALRKAKEEGRL